MIEEIIFAGFGGQGVMVMGQLISYAGMLEGKHVSWIPSYGPEMRGGTANCSVVVSDEEIGSPVVNDPDTVVALNLPSLERFVRKLKPKGLLIYNSSLIEKKNYRDDVESIAIPANDIAEELGSGKVANIVMLGAYLRKKGVIKIESVIESFRKVLPPRRHNLIPLNTQAIFRGAAFVGEKIASALSRDKK